jgi:hypothetical protein
MWFFNRFSITTLIMVVSVNASVFYLLFSTLKINTLINNSQPKTLLNIQLFLYIYIYYCFKNILTKQVFSFCRGYCGYLTYCWELISDDTLFCYIALWSRVLVTLRLIFLINTVEEVTMILRIDYRANRFQRSYMSWRFVKT